MLAAALLLELLIVPSTAPFATDAEVLARLASTSAAEAAYKWQRENPSKLRPEVLAFLGHPRWPCYWGEGFTGDLSTSKSDGGYGYRTCGLGLLRSSQELVAEKTPGKPCIIYSFGCDGDYEFERTIARLHGAHCEIHVFDPLDKAPDGQQVLSLGGESSVEEHALFMKAFEDIPMVSVSFHPIALLDHTWFEFTQLWSHANPVQLLGHTIPQLMAMLGHRHIDVLKLDIEGNEHRVISHLAEFGWPSMPGQIYMEVHVSPNVLHYEATHVKRLVHTLELAGMRLFHAEQPYMWCQAGCLQLSFIHKDWLPGIGGYPAAKGWLRYAVTHRHKDLLYHFSSNGTHPLAVTASKGVFVQRPSTPWPAVAAGAVFSVRWFMGNGGDHDMLAGCCVFRFVGGTSGWKLPYVDPVISQDVVAHSILKAAVELTVPSIPLGLHKTFLRLFTTSGTPIGEPIVVGVYVVAL